MVNRKDICMLGKNNFQERLKQMEMQDKHDQYSIRKLSIGAVSVLLGFSFFGINAESVKASEISPEQQTSQVATDSTTKTANNVVKENNHTDLNEEKSNKPDLTTYSGLSLFFKESNVDQSSASQTKQDSKVSKVTQKAINDSSAPNHEETEKSNSSTEVADSKENNDANDNASANSGTSNSNQKQDKQNKGDQTNNDLEQNKLPDDSSNKQPTKPAKQQPKANQNLGLVDIIGDTPQVEGNVAKVYNWRQFVNAYQQKKIPANTTINEIDIMNDISADQDNGTTGFDFTGRKLLIKSSGLGRHKIDFKGNHPNLTSANSLDLTYENLELYSADFFGVIDTANVGNQKEAVITFKNVNFHGSQMVYSSSRTHIHFVGDQNVAETIHCPYPGTTASNGDNQQLFEFTKSDNTIDFDEGNFIGKTIAGNIIQMDGSNNTVNVAKGATVNLDPRGNADGINATKANPAEGTGTVFAIVMRGDKETVNVQGDLNINIGSGIFSDYDYKQASAIYINKTTKGNTSAFNILNGGNVKINTNGDIAAFNKRRNLLYDGGDINIRPRGSLTIIGQNMGVYNDTLVLIEGTATVQNGSFEARLEGADTGRNAIILVDTGQGGSIIVNNPRSLILDAHLNKNPGTSIIGNNKISITNVRQALDLGDLLNGIGLTGSIALPPYHVLQVQKGSDTLNVNKIEMLNGNTKITSDYVKELEKKPVVSAILNQIPFLKTILEDAGKQNSTFDTVFAQVISKIFANSLLPGYNNARFIPANTSGFLDIDPTKVSVVTNEDGSREVVGAPGSVLNYQESKDGPESDGLFNKILPGGTDAYILASLKSPSGKITSWFPKNEQNGNMIESPYGKTADSDGSLKQKQFAAKVNNDGSFRLVLPTSTTANLDEKTQILLTPHANFVEYDPLALDEGSRPVAIDLKIASLANAQKEAAQAIKAAITQAKNNLPASLTPEQAAAFNQAMAQADAYTKQPTEKGYDENTSVYGAKDHLSVSSRQKKALAIIQAAIDTANAHDNLQTQKSKAIDELQSLANDQSAAYPSIKDKINQALVTATNNIKSSTTTADNLADILASEKENINGVVKSYKNSFKPELSESLRKAKDDLKTAGGDNNLTETQQTAINGLIDSQEITAVNDAIKQDGAIDLAQNEDQVKTAVEQAKGNLKSIQDKIAAIKLVEQEANKQIEQHSQDASEIKDALNQAVSAILAGSDHDGSAGRDAIANVHNEKTLAAAKIEIANAASAAKLKLQNSGLNVDEQQKYLNAIDQAVLVATAQKDSPSFDENKSIYGSNNDQEIANKVMQAKNLFEKEVAKAELAAYVNEIEQALETTTAENDKISTEQKNGTANIDAVSDKNQDGSIADIAEKVSAAKATAKENILNEVKILAKKRLEDKRDTVLDNIRNISGLTSENIANNEKEANNLLTSQDKTGYSDLIDTSQDFSEIKTHISEGIKALADLQAAANETAQRNNAISNANNAIVAKQNDVNKKIDELDVLNDQEKQSFKDQIAAAIVSYNNAVEKTPTSAISKLADALVSQIDNILQDATGKVSTEFKAQKEAALSSISKQAQDARDQISKISDEQLSSTNKEYYNDLINQAEQLATTQIKAAQNTTDLNAAANQGKVDIQDALTKALVEAARSAAINDLLTAKKKNVAVIEQASTDHKISKESAQKYIDSITGYYDKAVGLVKNDTSIVDINSDSTLGINSMNSVANSIADDEEVQQLAKHKQDALAELDRLANSTLAEIKANASLSGVEKDQYESQITDALSQAKIAIEAETAIDGIDRQKDVAKAKLANIGTTAAFQGAKEEAWNKLNTAKSIVTDQINKLDSIDLPTKNKFLKEVQDSYDKSYAAIKDPNPETIEQIKQSADDGVTELKNIVSDVNVAIAISQQNLNNHVAKVIQEINNSSTLTDDAKKETIAKIEDASATAIQNIGKATSEQDAKKAETDGENAIDKIVAESLDLAGLKEQAKASITTAANSAKSDLKTQYDQFIKDYNDFIQNNPNLTTAEKAAIKEDYDNASSAYEKATNSGQLIDTALTTATTKIDKAKNKSEVSDALVDGNHQITTIEQEASLAINKAQAKLNIRKASADAHTKLTDEKDIAALNDVVNQGLANIDAETDAGLVAKDEKNALNGINNVISIANSENTKKQREAALNELAAILNGDPETGTEGILKQIADLLDENGKQGLTPEQVAAFQQKAQNAYDTAKGIISGADAKDIAGLKAEAIANINQALIDAKLQVAKNKAITELNNIADQAHNNPDVGKDDQNAIEQSLKDAIATINQATDVNSVDAAKSAGEKALNGIVAQAKDSALKNEKVAARDDLTKQAGKLKDQISQSWQNHLIDQTQYDRLTNQVNEALTAINLALDGAGSIDEVRLAKGNGQTSLDQIKTDLDQSEALNKALSDLDKASQNAYQIVDQVAAQIGKTPEEISQIANTMKGLIDKEHDKAVNDVKTAQTGVKPISTMKQIVKDAQDAVTNLTDGFQQKNELIGELNKHADEIKAALSDPSSKLDPLQITAGENKIDQALQNGISAILKADKTADLQSLKDNAITAIDNAKLPSDLLTEKNTAIAAINDYAVQAKKTIDQNQKSDENPNGLAKELIDSLKDQVEQARKKTIDQINNVNLTALTPDSLNDAKANISAALNGSVPEGQVPDFGKKGIDVIVNLTKQKAGVVQAKQEAIAKLENERAAALTAIINSKLLPDEQIPFKNKVQQLYDSSKQAINDLTDSDEQEVKKKADDIIANAGFADLISQAKQQGNKSTALRDLVSKKAKASKIINASQLSPDDKKDALAEIDQLFTAASDKVNEGKDIPEDVGKEIDELWQSGHKPNDWFAKAKENALNGSDQIGGLQTEFNKLTDEQRNNEAYKQYLADINDGISAFGQANTMENINDAYDKGMTAINKLNAQEEISRNLERAKNEINSHQSLSQQDKDKLIEKVNDHAKSSRNEIDNIVAPVGDTTGKAEQIKSAIDNFKANIESYINQAKTLAKNNADQEIKETYQHALEQLNEKFGSHAVTAATAKAYNDHEHVTGDTPEAIEADKLTAIKEIANAAITDAISSAQKVVAELKHKDGSDYSAADKAILTKEIAKQGKTLTDNLASISDPEQIKALITQAVSHLSLISSDPKTISEILQNNYPKDSNISNPVVNPITNPDNKNPENKTEEVMLMHNAYLYNANGQRDNQIILGAGSIVTSHGITRINGRDFYILVDQGAKQKKYYLAVGNVQSTSRILRHNAFVYNKHGKRIMSAGIRYKGKQIKTYGSQVTIKGKKYYIIAHNRYVKAANVGSKLIQNAQTANVAASSALTSQNIIEKRVMHNSYLYDQSGIRANRLIVLAGSKLNFEKQTTINGRPFYRLSDGLYIAANNIDGQSVGLKHNAYIYNQHGERQTRRMLRKNQQIRVYGDPIKINGHKYYICDINKFVKAANF